VAAFAALPDHLPFLLLRHLHKGMGFRNDGEEV